MTEPTREPRQIGTDEWVARADQRTERRRGLAGALESGWKRLPPAAQLLVVVGAAAVFGGATSNDYYLRVGVNTLIYALLAVGLNVVVGWAGLLDLGFVAFFGFGAYCYAFLSSDQFGLHWPSLAALPVIVLACAALGLFVGLPSRRLRGDYLAIVTLFFAQIFYVLVNNADRITLPWKSHPTDIDRGPDGIAGIDNLSFLGIHVTSVRGYYYVALVIFTVVVAALWLVNNSRTGRAWRALRGTIRWRPSSWARRSTRSAPRLRLRRGGRRPDRHGLRRRPGRRLPQQLLSRRADHGLRDGDSGRSGQPGGVVLGAVVINVTLEILRTPGNARELFYLVIALALVKWVRPWRALAAVAGATVALGFVVHAIATAAWPSGTHPSPSAGRARP